MVEQWKGINGLPGYLISDRGRVYSIHYEKIIKVERNNMVKLKRRGEFVRFRIRNLVKAAFGLGCDRAEFCEEAENCWKCGLNPTVEWERRWHLRKRKLTKLPDGKYGFVIKAEDLDGWRLPKYELKSF